MRNHIKLAVWFILGASLVLNIVMANMLYYQHTLITEYGLENCEETK